MIYSLFYTIVALALLWNVFSSEQQLNSTILLPVIEFNRVSLTDNSHTVDNSILMILKEKVIRFRPCSCGGVGRTRVAYLNVSDPSTTLSF